MIDMIVFAISHVFLYFSFFVRAIIKPLVDFLAKPLLVSGYNLCFSPLCGLCYNVTLSVSNCVYPCCKVLATLCSWQIQINTIALLLLYYYTEVADNTFLSFRLFSFFACSCKQEHVTNNYPRGSTMPTMFRDKMSDYRDDIDEELYLEKRLETHDNRMKRIYDKELG